MEAFKALNTVPGNEGTFGRDKIQFGVFIGFRGCEGPQPSMSIAAIEALIKGCPIGYGNTCSALYRPSFQPSTLPLFHSSILPFFQPSNLPFFLKFVSDPLEIWIAFRHVPE
jgi:hypothetical protein